MKHPGRPPVIDLHTDALYEHVRGRRDITTRSTSGHVDLPRMKDGGVNGMVFAIWNNPRVFRRGERADFALGACDEFRRICRRHSGMVSLARSPDEFVRITTDGRIAGILGVEGGHALDGDIDNLDRFHRHGVRVLTLTWSTSNELGRSCMRKDGGRVGLSRLGREAVRRMNRLGMVVDLSHASDRTFTDAIETSTSPVICSHSGCHAIRRFPRNVSDRQLRMLGASGGVIGIVFLPYFLSRRWREATVENVVDHIEHAAAVAGIESVGLGSDFDGFGDTPPAGLEDVSRMPALAESLEHRGFSAADIRKVLGGNFLRAWKAIAGPGISSLTD